MKLRIAMMEVVRLDFCITVDSLIAFLIRR